MANTALQHSIHNMFTNPFSPFATPGGQDHECLPSLPSAASQALVDACTTSYPEENVKQAILHIATQVLALEEHTTLWKSKRKESHWAISLRTLYNRLCEGKLCPTLIPAASPRTLVTPSLIRTPDAGHTLHSVSTLSSAPTTYTPPTTSPTTYTLSSTTSAPTNSYTPVHATHAAIPINPHTRPLADYEDMYYALLAKVKEIHAALEVRVANRFATLSTPVCAMDPTTTTKSMTVGEVALVLREWWGVLNGGGFVNVLDEAVRRGRIVSMRKEKLGMGTIGEKQDADLQIVHNDRALAFRMLCGENENTPPGLGALGKACGAESSPQLFLEAKDGIRGAVELDGTMDTTVELKDEDDEEDVPGLAWINDWTPAMMIAWLEGKYRRVLIMEKDDFLAERRAVRGQRQGPGERVLRGYDLGERRPERQQCQKSMTQMEKLERNLEHRSEPHSHPHPHPHTHPQQSLDYHFHLRQVCQLSPFQPEHHNFQQPQQPHNIKRSLGRFSDHEMQGKAQSTESLERYRHAFERHADRVHNWRRVLKARRGPDV